MRNLTLLAQPNRTTGRSGMTLVELLLAMAIVSFILAAAYGVSSVLLTAREQYDAVSRATNIINSLQQLISEDLHNVYLKGGDEKVVWIKTGSYGELHIVTTNSLLANNGELMEVVYSWQTEGSVIGFYREEKSWTPDSTVTSHGTRYKLADLSSFSFSASNGSRQNSWTGNMLDPNWQDKADSTAANFEYIPGFDFDFSIASSTLLVNQQNVQESSSGKTLTRSFTVYFAGNRGALLEDS